MSQDFTELYWVGQKKNYCRLTCCQIFSNLLPHIQIYPLKVGGCITPGIICVYITPGCIIPGATAHTQLSVANLGFSVTAHNKLEQTFLPTQYKLNKQLFFESFWKLPFPRGFHVLCYLIFFFFFLLYLRGVKSSGRLNSESQQLENGWLFSMPMCALWWSRNLPLTAGYEQ